MVVGVIVAVFGDALGDILSPVACPVNGFRRTAGLRERTTWTIDNSDTETVTCMFSEPRSNPDIG